MESADKSLTETALIRDVSSILPGEFHLLDYIGEGGHGIVFKALFKPLQQIVALKLIKNDSSADMQKQLERMQNEARKLGKLDHPNIVKVFQTAFCKDGTPFLVCEYVSGITLADFLEQKGTLKLELIEQIFSQILDALSFSHDHELIHRDIKPSNIMLSFSSDKHSVAVKLLDFGIARDFDESIKGPLGLTRTIQITGSAPYMSPEQCSGAPIDLRSDIYSVACVLYQSLAGRPPFLGETPVHTRYKQIHESARVPSENTDQNVRIKAELYKVVLKALSKPPGSRPQNASEFKRCLLAACAKTDYSAPAPRKNVFRKNTLIIAALSMILLIAFALLCLDLSGKQKAQPTSVQDLQPQKDLKHRIDGHSSLHLLSDASKDFYKVFHTPKETIEYSRLAVAAWEKLDYVIPRINKKDNAQLFSAYYLRAQLAGNMNCEKDFMENCQKALSYCRNKDGQEYDEAAAVYCTLASSR